MNELNPCIVFVPISIICSPYITLEVLVASLYVAEMLGDKHCWNNVTAASFTSFQSFVFL